MIRSTTTPSTQVIPGKKAVIVTPHCLASQAGRDVLNKGGNAAQAIVAAVSTLAVVYPHANGLGADGFLLLRQKGKNPVGINASGPAAALANAQDYLSRGCTSIDNRGSRAVLTVPGGVSGLQKMLDLSREWEGEQLPLPQLLAAARLYAKEGFPVSASQARLAHTKLNQLCNVPGFSNTFCRNGIPFSEGEVMKQHLLSNTLSRLAEKGLDEFYRGETGRILSAFLEKQGSTLRWSDFKNYQAQICPPLSINTREATLYNLDAPTQGMTSLGILGTFARLSEAHPKSAFGNMRCESFAHIHGLVECAKPFYTLRNHYITDPKHMSIEPKTFLSEEKLVDMAKQIRPQRALAWPTGGTDGDTVWIGCLDAYGNSVSAIYSLAWEFGSGLVCPETGVLFANRGTYFSLDANHANVLRPGKLTYQTLNPAMAIFHDGREMVYGSMGGEGQPQFQSAIYSRYGIFRLPLAEAVNAPRWALGKTRGDSHTSLKLENRFGSNLIEQLRQAGHNVEVLPEAFSEAAGQAGAAVRQENGTVEGAADIHRSPGSAEYA